MSDYNLIFHANESEFSGLNVLGCSDTFGPETRGTSESEHFLGYCIGAIVPPLSVMKFIYEFTVTAGESDEGFRSDSNLDKFICIRPCV